MCVDNLMKINKILFSLSHNIWNNLVYVFAFKLIHILPKNSSINKNSWQEPHGAVSRNYRKPAGMKQDDDTNYDEVQMSLSEVMIIGDAPKIFILHIFYL